MGGGPQSPSLGRFKGVSRGGKSKSPLWCFLGFGTSLTSKRSQDAVKTHSPNSYLRPDGDIGSHEGRGASTGKFGIRRPLKTKPSHFRD